MPRQQPGASKQDYGTPDALLAAVKRRLGIREFDVDLAAHRGNAVCACWFGPRSTYGESHYDALAHWVRWGLTTRGWSWLNPPFADIYPWTRKAQREASRYGARVAMLVPLSMAQWWVDHVHDNDNCLVLPLVGRVTFNGCDKPYPKDCAILLFAAGINAARAGYHLWAWRAGQGKRTKKRKRSGKGTRNGD